MVTLRDEAVLATIVTAFLIREGGQTSFTEKEWKDAVDHESTLYVHRDEPTEPMLVALMHKTVEA